MYVCCVFCSIYIFEYLIKYVDVIIYFVNFNIYFKVEYYKCVYVIKKFVSDFNEWIGNSV